MIPGPPVINMIAANRSSIPFDNFTVNSSQGDLARLDQRRFGVKQNWRQALATWSPIRRSSIGDSRNESKTILSGTTATDLQSDTHRIR